MSLGKRSRSLALSLGNVSNELSARERMVQGTYRQRYFAKLPGCRADVILNVRVALVMTAAERATKMVEKCMMKRSLTIIVCDARCSVLKNYAVRSNGGIHSIYMPSLQQFAFLPSRILPNIVYRISNWSVSHVKAPTLTDLHTETAFRQA